MTTPIELRPWAGAEIKCLNCGHEWEAVFHAATDPDRLQCPECLEPQPEPEETEAEIIPLRRDVGLEPGTV